LGLRVEIDGGWVERPGLFCCLMAYGTATQRILELEWFAIDGCPDAAVASMGAKQEGHYSGMSQDSEFLARYKNNHLYIHPGKDGAYAAIANESEEVLGEIDVTAITFTLEPWARSLVAQKVQKSSANWRQAPNFIMISMRSQQSEMLWQNSRSISPTRTFLRMNGRRFLSVILGYSDMD